MHSEIKSREKLYANTTNENQHQNQTIKTPLTRFHFVFLFGILNWKTSIVTKIKKLKKKPFDQLNGNKLQLNYIYVYCHTKQNKNEVNTKIAAFVSSLSFPAMNIASILDFVG